MGESDCMACTVERKQREVRGDADEPRIDVCPVHSTCRRCSECVGEDHHFMGPESFEDGVGFECKHCDYTTPAEECAECEELFPVDILKRSHGNGDYFCSEHLARAEGDDRCAD